MTTKFKNFILFDLDAPGAGRALAEIDSCIGAGNPTVYGHVCCVGFWVGSDYKNDEKYAKEQIDKCKKILAKHNVKYKYSTFTV